MLELNQLKSGAILSYLTIFITSIVALLYTPIMIRFLGQSEYGLYSMIGSIAAYLSVLDLGLGNAIVRYTARNRALGDKHAESTLNGMFLLMYSFIGILTVFLGIAVYNSIENIFGKSLTPSELQDAKFMIIVLIINFALSFPLSIFGSIMQAYEKFVFVKIISIIRSLIVPLITLPFLFLGFGAVTMVVISSIINIFCLLLNVYYCISKLKIKFHFEYPDKKVLKEIIGYSFFIFLGVVVDQVNWNTGQLILGAFGGTSIVAIFAIGIQFVRLYLQFSTSISGLFLPRISMMVAKNADVSELTSMMIKYGRIQYIILAFILSGFILYGQKFIEIWAGNDYLKSYYIVLAIMIPITIPLIQNIGISILQAKNLQGFRSIILIFIALLNIAISLVLVKQYGGLGVAIGTGSSYLIGNGLIMNIYYHYKIGINVQLFWRNILSLSFVVLTILFVGLIMNYFIVNDSLLFYMIKIFCFSLIFLSSMWLLGFNNYEKKLFKSLFLPLKIIFIKFKY